jgi:fatty acid desaturase
MSMSAAALAQPEPMTDEFGPLRRAVREQGLLEPRSNWYARSIALTAAALIAIAAIMIVLGSSWWQLALAVPAAVFTARVAFVGHDAGHRQITRSGRLNRALGLVHGNLLIGMSYGWWTSKHNKHHAHPNDVERDPDVGLGPIVWTPGQASTRRRRLTRWLTRNQAKLFIPLLLLEGINLKASSIRHLRRTPGRTMEKALLTAHFLGYASFLLAVMSPWQALAFAAVHQALFGVHLGCAFAPNHKGMPMPPPGTSWGHLRQQVLTSRNVTGGPVTDWLLGGLNYQIEHHLFPSMPRPNLRLAQPVVRRHCELIGLPYTEEGALHSYAQALGQRDDDAFGATQVAEQEDVLVAHHLPISSAPCVRSRAIVSSMSSTANMRRRSTRVFGGAFLGSGLIIAGRW